MSYITHRSSGYGFESLAELPEIPGIGAHGRTELTEVSSRYENAVPVPRVFVALAYRTSRSSGYGYECPTERTEVPGTGNTQVNNGLGGEVRFEVEGSIERAWHVLIGPTSPRQSVVALRANDS